MNLLEIRQKLITLSGRYDLVADAHSGDYTDGGANFFIQQGQRYLDRRAGIDKESARVFKQVEAGKFAVLFQSCRVIEEVWVADASSRTQLRRVNYDKLRGTDYPSGENAYVEAFSAMTQGTPLYYSPVHLRLAPGQAHAVAGLTGGFLGYLDISIGTAFNTNGVIILPPPDGEYMVEVKGKFYSDSLNEDDNESTWSSEYPDILLMSALRHMEVFNRNMTGVKEYSAAIDDMILDIGKDVADQESTGFDQLEG